MSDYFTEKDLARRWKVSTRTLQRWRRLGTGPEYLKLGSRVIYALHEVEAWEHKHRRARTRSR